MMSAERLANVNRPSVRFCVNGWFQRLSLSRRHGIDNEEIMARLHTYIYLVIDVKNIVSISMKSYKHGELAAESITIMKLMEQPIKSMEFPKLK